MLVPLFVSTRQHWCKGASATRGNAQGVNMTALREIKLLKELDSPHIVRLLEVFPHKRNLSLVCSKSAIWQTYICYTHAPV